MQNTHLRRNQSSYTGSYHASLYTMLSSPSKEFMKVHADTLKIGRKVRLLCTLHRELLLSIILLSYLLELHNPMSKRGEGRCQNINNPKRRLQERTKKDSNILEKKIEKG